eukprot:5707177-Amphidinium_carterae.1
METTQWLTREKWERLYRHLSPRVAGGVWSQHFRTVASRHREMQSALIPDRCISSDRAEMRCASHRSEACFWGKLSSCVGSRTLAGCFLVALKGMVVTLVRHSSMDFNSKVSEE